MLYYFHKYYSNILRLVVAWVKKILHIEMKRAFHILFLMVLLNGKL